jgi:hypothetical protein
MNKLFNIVNHIFIISFILIIIGCGYKAPPRFSENISDDSIGIYNDDL